MLLQFFSNSCDIFSKNTRRAAIRKASREGELSEFALCPGISDTTTPKRFHIGLKKVTSIVAQKNI